MKASSTATALSSLDYEHKLIRFTNCFVLKDEDIIHSDLWIQDGVILDGLDLFFNRKATADIRIDLHGAIISPGFIDTQVNGGYGLDFSCPNSDIVKSLEEIGRRLPQTGVTTFCPTLITSAKDTYKSVLIRFRQYRHQAGCAKVLGLHMEGPFISKHRAGMHTVELISDFGPDPLETLSETYGENLDSIRMVTIAPEVPGSTSAIRELVSRGITVSIGHTDANCTALKEAVLSGATFMTHLFNAMPAFHHRKSHLFGGITIPTPVLYVGVIADLVHVHAAALRVAEAIAPGRVVLVTDANTAFGLPDGTYDFGGQQIEVTNGIAYVAGTDCLAGGTTPMTKCISNFWIEVCQQSHRHPLGSTLYPGLGEALAAASTRPALGLRLYQKSTSNLCPKLAKGCLEPGAEADLVMLCPDSLSRAEGPTIEILSTWIDGKAVYTSESANFSIHTSVH